MFHWILQENSSLETLNLSDIQWWGSPKEINAQMYHFHIKSDLMLFFIFWSEKISWWHSPTDFLMKFFSSLLKQFQSSCEFCLTIIVFIKIAAKGSSCGLSAVVTCCVRHRLWLLNCFWVFLRNQCGLHADYDLNISSKWLPAQNRNRKQNLCQW